MEPNSSKAAACDFKLFKQQLTRTPENIFWEANDVTHTHILFTSVYIYLQKKYIYIYTHTYILYMHWIPFLSCQFPCPFPFHSIHTYGDGLKPIIPYFGGLYNIHLPALLIFTMVTGIWLMSMYCDEPLNIKA